MEMTSPDIFVIDTDADAGPAQIPPSRENVHTLDCVIDREENQEESRNMKDKCGHETVRTKPDGSLEDRIFVRDSASKNSGASCSVSERTVSDEMKFEQKRRKKDEGASSSVHLTPKIQESRLSAEENDDFFLTSSFGLLRFPTFGHAFLSIFNSTLLVLSIYFCLMVVLMVCVCVCLR